MNVSYYSNAYSGLVWPYLKHDIVQYGHCIACSAGKASGVLWIQCSAVQFFTITQWFEREVRTRKVIFQRAIAWNCASRLLVKVAAVYCPNWFTDAVSMQSWQCDSFIDQTRSFFFQNIHPSFNQLQTHYKHFMEVFTKNELFSDRVSRRDYTGGREVSFFKPAHIQSNCWLTGHPGTRVIWVSWGLLHLQPQNKNINNMDAS